MNRSLPLVDQARTRRAFFRDLATGAMVLVPVGAAVATGCGQKLTCTDVAGLKPEEQQQRTTMKYQEPSPIPEKRCDNCIAFQPKSPSECGGCTELKGPVHPQGYCTVWRQKV